MMDNVRLSFLFYRYVNNDCSESERQELLRLMADPENDAQVKRLMTSLWHQSPGKKLLADQSDRIVSKILSRESPTYLPWLKMAAIFMMVTLSAVGIFYFRATYLKSSLTKRIAEDAKTDFVELPDGSTVILKAGGKLSYPESFAGSLREVWLEGEAFFDIESDPSGAFVVHTGKLRTTVLGTAFNIRAYPDQEVITVTVKRGKVKVSDDKQIFGILNSDEQISLDRRHQIAEQTTVDTDLVTGWIERDISFDNVTMKLAIAELQKRFDVPISLDGDDTGNCRFTATFVQGEDLNQILSVLCEFNNASLSQSDTGGFVISGGDCR